MTIKRQGKMKLCPNCDRFISTKNGVIIQHKHLTTGKWCTNMNEQELLQSIIGKTIKSIEPFIIGNEIEFIEVTFEDDTVVDISAQCNMDKREGFLSLRTIVQGTSNED